MGSPQMQRVLALVLWEQGLQLMASQVLRGQALALHRRSCVGCSQSCD